MCRVEMPGYAPASGPLRKVFGPGRLVGAIFTLGIVYAFRSPMGYRRAHDFSLEPIAGTSVQVPAPPAPGPSMDDRLLRVRKLRERGLISDEELKRYEAEILRAP